MAENIPGGVLWQIYCVQEKKLVDIEGFMTNYEDWDYSVAEIRAKREGI